MGRLPLCGVPARRGSAAASWGAHGTEGEPLRPRKGAGMESWEERQGSSQEGERAKGLRGRVGEGGRWAGRAQGSEGESRDVKGRHGSSPEAPATSKTPPQGPLCLGSCPPPPDPDPQPLQPQRAPSFHLGVLLRKPSPPLLPAERVAAQTLQWVRQHVGGAAHPLIPLAPRTGGQSPLGPREGAAVGHVVWARDPLHSAASMWGCGALGYGQRWPWNLSLQPPLPFQAKVRQIKARRFRCHAHSATADFIPKPPRGQEGLTHLLAGRNQQLRAGTLWPLGAQPGSASSLASQQPRPRVDTGRLRAGATQPAWRG